MCPPSSLGLVCAKTAQSGKVMREVSPPFHASHGSPPLFPTAHRRSTEAYSATSHFHLSRPSVPAAASKIEAFLLFNGARRAHPPSFICTHEVDGGVSGHRALAAATSLEPRVEEQRLE